MYYRSLSSFRLPSPLENIHAQYILLQYVHENYVAREEDLNALEQVFHRQDPLQEIPERSRVVTGAAVAVLGFLTPRLSRGFRRNVQRRDRGRRRVSSGPDLRGRRRRRRRVVAPRPSTVTREFHEPFHRAAVIVASSLSRCSCSRTAL